MRRLWSSLLSALLAVSLLALSAAPALAEIRGTDYVGSTTVTDRKLTVTEAPTIDASYGILVDAEGNVLWSRGADKRSAMASITKIMTAVVTLENASLEDTYTVSAAAASVGESSAGLAQGDTVTVYQLLCGLLIHSGNDAGVVLAEGVAGSVDAFVDMMNAKAQELGLVNTHYTNPHGLDDPDHYSSAYDIAVLSRYAMNNETFSKIVKKKRITLDYGGHRSTFRSTNSLLNTWKYCNGVKTGYTNNAGYCLSSAAKKDGLQLYAVVLGCADEGQRFTDCYRLLNWGFSHYLGLQLAGAEDVLAEVPVSGYLNRTVKAGVSEDVSARVLDYDGDISIDIALMDLPDGADEGDRVGIIIWRQGEIAVASAPLVAKERVGKPLAISSVWTAVCRLVGWFTGDDCVAQTVLHVETIEVSRADSANGEVIDEDMEESIRKDAARNA